MTKLGMRLSVAFILLLWSGVLFAQKDSLTLKAGAALLETSPNFNLLYRPQAKKTTTAAVGEIYSSQLQKNVSTTFGGWLTGRLAGLNTFQPLGEPGYDDITVYLRGQAPMVLIDGTPQSFPSINPEQIESVTVLKDAVSTAMLGMRGGNGAINITTKKGIRQSQRIEFNVLYGIQSPTQLPKYLNSYDYARLYNEALANDGIAPVYSQADLDAYKNGSDPIGHPNVDWQKQLLKSNAPFSRYDFAISGGNRTTRYFVNLDYLKQDGLLKEEDFNVYETNSMYKRYILRSNLEVDLSKYVTTSLNLFGRVQNSNQPGSTTGTIFNNFRNTPNNAYPVKNSDGSLGGNLDYQNNIYGQSTMSGYMPVYERDFKVDLTLRGNLDAITKGLWVKALAALNAYQRETINRSKTFAVFKQNTDLAGNKTYIKYGNTSDQANVNNPNSQNRLFYTEASMGYTKQLSSDNTIEALVVASNDLRRINSDLPFNFTTVAAKVSYDMKHKYFIDLTAGYNGTERFPKSKRYGLFPALGLGWEISQESFLKNKLSWLDYLKLRASYGKTGNANVGYYDYYQYYVTGTGYGFGATVPSSTTTLQQGALANPTITWEKANKFSTGIDAALFANKLTVSIDYFNDKYYDLVQSRLNGSDILGTDYMRENIGENRFSGVEFQTSWQESKKKFSYFIAPNFSVLKSEVLYMGEPDRMYNYLRQTGKPVGQAFGYVADGLFMTQAEINGHAFQGASIVPGDIKYKDLNSDGVIDANDQQAIGSTKPFLHYGINTGISFSGVDIAILLQGVANSNIQVTGYRAFQNGGRGQAYEETLDRWQPGSTAQAPYPRLWVGNNTNNMRTSSFWMVSGDYLRIKSIELGYSIPTVVLAKAKMSGVRIFVNATNLLTFSKLNKRNIDPEGTAGAYPIMKTVNGGITIKL